MPRPKSLFREVQHGFSADAVPIVEVAMRSGHLHIAFPAALRMLIWVAALLLLGQAPLEAAPAPPVARILVLNSYHFGYDWSDAELQGLGSALSGKFPRVALSVEYLDSKNFPQKTHFPQLATLLESKYRGSYFDVIIAMDNAALEFATRYRGRLFPETPLVFCGVNDYDPAMIQGQRKITGVAENQDSLGTLSMALGLHPGTREVVVLHDYTDTGLAMRHELAAYASKIPRIKFRFLEEMRLETAAARLKELPSDCLVLLLSYSAEKGGRSFSQSEVARVVSEASSVPVYAVHAAQLGQGVVGGRMMRGEVQGEQAAQLAISIIDGKAPGELPVITRDLTHAMFDYRVVQRLGIDLDKLPGDAIIINQPASSYAVDKSALWGAAIFAIALTTGLIVLQLNIQRRKRLEKVLRMTEAKFREIFNSAGDAIYIHGFDAGTLEVNQAACHLMGYQHHRLLSLSLNELYAPEQIPNIPRWVATLRQKGRALYETVCLTSGGENIPVEVSSKVIEYEDKPAILSIVRDISRRKRHELREKTRLKILEEMATGAPLEHLLTFIVRFVEQEIPGSLCSILLANEAGTRLQHGAAISLPASYNKAVDGLSIRPGAGSCGTAAFLRKRVIVEDIESHPFWKGFQPARDAGLRACWSEPVLSVDGELFGTFAVYYRSCRSPGEEELTLLESAAHMASIAIGHLRSDESRSNLEEQMRQMQKFEAIGQMAGGLAHDFNNLLTPIFVYADIIKGSLTKEDANWNKIGGIISCSQKAADLTRKLLSFGRKQVLKMEVMDLNNVVVSLQDLMQRTIRENIEIKANLTPLGANLLADRGQLEQILVNLAVNAQDAIAGNGEILIETGNVTIDEEFAKLNPGMKTGPHILLSFTDNGCGMTEEVLHHIFEPFFTTKPLGQGTGLGLATVYGIVKQHNGYLKALSQVGKGTSFLIYLPKSSGKIKPGTLEHPVSLNALQGLRDKTIMVVDDNEMIREMAVELLEGCGFRVLVAETPMTARKMELSHRASIDLLVTDVVMPEMSGPELYECLAVKYPALPVLYISGYSFDAKAQNRSGSEVASFLPKPFTSEQFLHSIQQALDP
jgi:two-component system, cell cycle sensor histidine kinase and response regulator CckA